MVYFAISAGEPRVSKIERIHVVAGGTEKNKMLEIWNSSFQMDWMFVKTTFESTFLSHDTSIMDVSNFFPGSEHEVFPSSQ